MFWLKAFKKRSVNDDSQEIAQYTYSQQNTRQQKRFNKIFSELCASSCFLNLLQELKF